VPDGRPARRPPGTPRAHAPFAAGRSAIEVAATAPVSSALPMAVTHWPTVTSGPAACTTFAYVVADVVVTLTSFDDVAVVVPF